MIFAVYADENVIYFLRKRNPLMKMIPYFWVVAILAIKHKNCCLGKSLKSQV